MPSVEPVTTETEDGVTLAGHNRRHLAGAMETIYLPTAHTGADRCSIPPSCPHTRCKRSERPARVPPNTTRWRHNTAETTRTLSQWAWWCPCSSEETTGRYPIWRSSSWRYHVSRTNKSPVGPNLVHIFRYRVTGVPPAPSGSLRASHRTGSAVSSTIPTHNHWIIVIVSSQLKGSRNESMEHGTRTRVNLLIKIYQWECDMAIHFHPLISMQTGRRPSVSIRFGQTSFA